MRILMLNYEFPPLGGGAGNATKYLLREYSKRDDVKVDLVTSSKGKAIVEKFSKNITIYKLDVGKKNVHFWTFYEMFKWSVKSYFLVRKLLKSNKYDICHCWFGWPCGIIGRLFKSKVPYIVALRGSDVPGYNPRLKVLDKLVFSWISKIVWGGAKRVVANSKGLKDLALKTLDCRIDVIYNGVDTDEFKPSKVNSKSKVLRLVSTGRLIERKGYKYLIRAMEGIDNIKLTLIGEGNQEDSLKELAKGLDVDFVGYVEHSKIVKYYQNADVFVLPSLNEGMSNSVLEAMACGLPVIVTDVGGTKELVKGNGFVVGHRDVIGLRDNIKKYKNDSNLRDKHAKGSRKVTNKLNWGSMSDKYMGVY